MYVSMDDDVVSSRASLQDEAGRTTPPPLPIHNLSRRMAGMYFFHCLLPCDCTATRFGTVGMADVPVLSYTGSTV